MGATSQIEDEIEHNVFGLKARHPDWSHERILKEAHDRALASRPDLDSKTAADRKRRADEARRLASLNVKSKIGAAPKSTGKDMWSEMADIYDRVANQRHFKQERQKREASSRSELGPVGLLRLAIAVRRVCRPRMF